MQTSIGISSGLAQTSPDSIHSPGRLIVPRATPCARPLQFKSALLRLDSFLGEWLSPEYFEFITPPPGPALMMGGAKADLLRREDYSAYTDALPEEKPVANGCLWHASSASSPANGAPSPAFEHNTPLDVSSLAPALPGQHEEPRTYVAPRPLYVISTSGKIPEGFVAHARDACVTVDYQWDSMREPLDFGDGGKLGEEWTAMHMRFRGGLRRLVNWYATMESPADLVTKPAKSPPGHGPEVESEDEEVETVIIIVSHGAGCNALIGAITHQPVLMDVGLASITMATRKPSLDYAQMRAAVPPSADPRAMRLVEVDRMYDMRLSASTEHLHSFSSTPVSSRSTSAANIWNTNSQGNRGRTSTLGSSGAPIVNPFAYHDLLSSPLSRSTSVGATVGNSFRRESASQRPALRGLAIATAGLSGVVSTPSSGTHSPNGASSFGLWSQAPSSLRLMDDGGEDMDDFGSLLPDFDQKRFAAAPAGKDDREPWPKTMPSTAPKAGEAGVSTPKHPPKGPVFAAPIKIHTNVMADRPSAEEVKMSQLGGGLGGLWGLPPPLDEAERFRDLSHTKRRWTVNERV